MNAQTLKKVRMGSSSTNVSFLALYTAFHRGFFKDEGIDLEIIYMPANLASTAVLNGDVDYNGAVTGTIGAAVHGQPMKVLLFTVSKPLLFLVGQKNIKDMKQLRRQENRRQLARRLGHADCQQVLKQIGLGPGKGCLGPANVRRRREPSMRCLNPASSMRRFYPCRKTSSPSKRAINELLFLGDVIEFPQNGFGTSEKKRIRENPDEVYRMVRATLRGLQFVWDTNNQRSGDQHS